MYYPPVIKSVNGSSASSICLNPVVITTKKISVGLCTNTTSSVLFDGNIPTLTGLDGDDWASQLLTIEKTSSANLTQDDLLLEVEISISRIEVVLFNCPQWGVATHTVIVNEINNSVPKILSNKSISTTLTSCTSLVKVCVIAETELPLVSMRFLPFLGSTWVHLAEVVLRGRDSSSCPPDTILDGHTPPIPLPSISQSTFDSLPTPTSRTKTSDLLIASTSHPETTSVTASTYHIASESHLTTSRCDSLTEFTSHTPYASFPTPTSHLTSHPLATSPLHSITDISTSEPITHTLSPTSPSPLAKILGASISLIMLAIIATVGSVVAVCKYRSKLRVQYERVELIEETLGGEEEEEEGEEKKEEEEEEERKVEEVELKENHIYEEVPFAIVIVTGYYA